MLFCYKLLKVLQTLGLIIDHSVCTNREVWQCWKGNTTQQLNHNLINCYKLKVCETLTNCISATSCWKWKHCFANIGANYWLFGTILDPNHNLSVCVQFTYVENLSARSCWEYCSAIIGANYWLFHTVCTISLGGNFNWMLISSKTDIWIELYQLKPGAVVKWAGSKP